MVRSSRVHVQPSKYAAGWTNRRDVRSTSSLRNSHPAALHLFTVADFFDIHRNRRQPERINHGGLYPGIVRFGSGTRGGTCSGSALVWLAHARDRDVSDRGRFPPGGTTESQAGTLDRASWPLYQSCDRGGATCHATRFSAARNIEGAH